MKAVFGSLFVLWFPENVANSWNSKIAWIFKKNFVQSKNSDSPEMYFQKKKSNDLATRSFAGLLTELLSSLRYIGIWSDKSPLRLSIIIYWLWGWKRNDWNEKWPFTPTEVQQRFPQFFLDQRGKWVPSAFEKRSQNFTSVFHILVVWKRVFNAAERENEEKTGGHSGYTVEGGLRVCVSNVPLRVLGTF